MSEAPSERPPATDAPGFANENAARRAVIDACLRMNALGINQGKSGNVSSRWDRGGAVGYLITPSGVDYERLVPDDIGWIALDAEDALAPGASDSRLAPSSEWRMHREIYRARAEAGAVVHAHSPCATALACLPRVQQRGIPAFHYMVAIAGGDDIRCARYATFGSAELAASMLEALRGRRACLLANHGLIAFGRTPDAALALAAEVETLARMYAQALALGEPVILGEAAMREVLERFATYGPARR